MQWLRKYSDKFFLVVNLETITVKCDFSYPDMDSLILMSNPILSSFYCSLRFKIHLVPKKKWFQPVSITYEILLMYLTVIKILLGASQ